MKKLVLLFSLFGFWNFTNAQLLITQVYEGADNNKWIEITNTSMGDLNLSSPLQYKVGIWQLPGSSGNGIIFGAPSSYILLSGIIPKGQKYLIKNTNASTTVPHAVMPEADNQNTTVASFDGNDALAIFTDTNTIVDAFGVGINYNNVSYTRDQRMIHSKSSFDASHWIQHALSTVGTSTTSSNLYIGIHNYFGMLYTNTSLISINKEYGAISPVGSFNLTRFYSAYSSTSPGVAPPPPGITPETYLYAPADFETCLSANFSTAIGDNVTPLMVDNSNNTNISKTVYYRLKTNASVGNKSGTFRATFDIPQLNLFDFYIPTQPINLVSPKSLLISGLMANNKTFDGTTTATLNGTPALDGLEPQDVSNVSLSGTPIAVFSDALVGENKPVSVSGFTLAGSSSANYVLQQPSSLSASIFPTGLLSQNITFDSLPATVTYGDSSFEVNAVASSGLPVMVTSSNPNIIAITGTTATIVGAGEVLLTASQGGNSEYEPAVAISQTIVVLPKQLVVSGLTVDSKIYNGNTQATVSSSGSVVGVINDDVVAHSATAFFLDANVGNDKNVTITYTLSGQDATNYMLSDEIKLASIQPKEISIDGILGNNKVYDGTTSASVRGTAVPIGVISNDVFDVFVEGNPLATFDTPSTGTNKTITVSGYTLNGSASSNYSLLQPLSVVADVTRKSLTLSGISANTKVYDRNVSATIVGTPIVEGVIPSEEQSVILAPTLTATFSDFNVGTNKSVTVVGSISGSASLNYILEPLVLSASITQKQLTILSPAVADKTYDGTTVATLSGTLSGVIAPDNVVFNRTAVFNDPIPAQNKPVTSTSTITGSAASNYNLIQPIGLTASIIGSACNSASGFAYWNATATTFTSVSYQGLGVSAIQRVNNNGTNSITSTSSPSNYAGASGTSNFTASAFVGAFNAQTSTYFQFTITPNANIQYAMTELRLGSRSNSNGPQAFVLRSSSDNYTSDLATGTLSPNNTWSIQTLSVSHVMSTQPITYRIYGFGGVGANSLSIPNWRIDDVRVSFNVTTVPPLTSSLTASACSGVAFNYVPSTSYLNAAITWTRNTVQGISNAAVSNPQSTPINEVLLNTTASSIDVNYHFTVTYGDCVLEEEVVVSVQPSQNWYYDGDGDGFGNALVSQVSCSQPTNYVLDATDCDDSLYSLTNTCNTLLNLKLFVQGYYTGSNQMNSSRTNPNNTTVNYVDDVTVELRQATTLELIDTKVVSLYPDGSAQCTFPSALNGLYYISVKGSNSLKTWSATPIAFGAATIDYDFSDAANKAFGANMVEVSSGVWALISGDINSDGNVDNSDYSVWESDANEFASGTFITDLNGDGNVDNTDYSIWEANANSFVFSISPTP